jgi:hypothetical protein
MIATNTTIAERPRLAHVLADAIELSDHDRGVLAVFLRFDDIGDVLCSESFRRASDAKIRALCGRPLPEDMAPAASVEV